MSELNDPNGQLAFLIDELNLLEKQKGTAILIGHIFPSECTHPWALRFRAVLERYQAIIRINLFGHSHSDEFKLSLSYDAT